MKPHVIPFIGAFPCALMRSKSDETRPAKSMSSSKSPLVGKPIKYEMDKAAGTLVVDRFLYTAMRYPGNYGFIPHTLSDGWRPL